MIEREEVEAQAQALDALAEMPLEGENTDPFIEVMRLCGHQTATMLRALMAERDTAFKAGEDAMQERAAHMIERAGKGTNIQFVTDVMGVAIRALANQPPAKGG